MLERIASNPPGVASSTTRVIAAELGLWISVESAGGGVLVVPRGELDHETVEVRALSRQRRRRGVFAGAGRPQRSLVPRRRRVSGDRALR